MFLLSISILKLLDSGRVSISQQCGNRCTDAARVVRDNFTEYFNTAGVVNWQNNAIAKGNIWGFVYIIEKTFQINQMSKNCINNLLH